jgi:periplasmic protein TonB
MSERWRDELRTLKQRKLIFWAVLVSVLLHLAVFLVIFNIPTNAVKESVAQPKPMWMDLTDFQAPPERPRGEILTQRMRANEKVPKTARFLAEKNNAVEKETHIADQPINTTTGAVGPRSRRPGGESQTGRRRPAKKYKIPDVGQGMRAKSKSKNGRSDAPGTGRGAEGKGTKDLINSVRYSGPGSGSGGGNGNLSPFNPDVGAPGDAVSLNTRDFKYIGYFQGVKEKIEWAWVYPQRAQQMGQQGILTISFTILRSGKLKEVKTVRSSGFPLLDTAASRAVSDANFFGPFPESWPDEELTIVANFHYRLIGTKSIF